uniref:Uncharacterized protein n=1 Tax=Klebsormidium flaccidum TaxID=3175 RepID=A0A0B5H840_KLEFL|nr:hypothetical protein [Klebsormidium flaccidum]
MNIADLKSSDLHYCPIVRLHLCSDHDSLFTSLINAGLKSKLTNHFAKCEASDFKYTSLNNNNNILFKKTKQRVKQTKATTKSDKSAPVQVNTVYKLKEGVRSFQELLQLDESFLPNILKGFELGLWKVFRIHLCIDLKENIMPYVSQSIKTGQYSSFGRHPYGYGWLDGERVRLCVGRNSRIFKEFKGQALTLDIICFGDEEKSSEIAVFYNKEKEYKVNPNPMCLAKNKKSRVEVRIYPRCTKTNKIAISILTSFLKNTDGSERRVSSFVEVLCRCVQFTTKNCPWKFIKSENIAPWWRTLLQRFMDRRERLEFCNKTHRFQFQPQSQCLPDFFSDASDVKNRGGRPKGSKDKRPRKPASGLKKCQNSFVLSKKQEKAS